MAFAGLKKQINKANQYVTEKMGGAEGTKLDLDFMDMEKKTDVTVELVEELQVKTKEFLQPNPTARAKMAAVKGISKLSGQAKSNTYPQPEGLLADCMLMYGKKLGENSIFADCLIEMGESLRQMADVKYSLDDNIKQNVLEPLHHLQTKDLKEVMHHRKKLQGRRLDYDCKRRRQQKGSHITDEEIRGAEEKFAESLHAAQMGMFNLLENDVEQVSQLVTFAEGLLEFHAQCADILKILCETLQEKREECASRPRAEFVPKTLTDINIESGLHGSTEAGINGARFLHPSSTSYHSSSQSSTQSSFNNNHHNSRAPLSRLGANGHHSSQRNARQLTGSSTGSGLSAGGGNTAARNIYSSHQNLSKHSNFARSRTFGSQQSLNGGGAGGGGAAAGGAASGGGGGNNNGDTVDWLNAWSSPPAASATQRLPAGSTSNGQQRSQQQLFSSSSNNNNHHHTNHLTTSSTNFNHNSNNILFNDDPWTVSKPNHLELDNGQAHQARSTNASPLPSPMRSPARTPMVPPPMQQQQRPSGPHCTAIYDFEPENPGELGFKENDIITLLQKVDENWFEGSVNGRTGYFPQSYVQVVTPLP